MYKKTLLFLLKYYSAISTPVNLITGLAIGRLAAEYSMWILLLGIPYVFQMMAAMMFKDR